ncbi:hypothetical protein [Klebsiella quasipneumoniae]
MWDIRWLRRRARKTR